MAGIVAGHGRAASAPPGLSRADAATSALVQAAHRLQLASSPAWRRLLLYVPRWGGGEDSVVSSPAFFFAPAGARDPSAELDATLAAFLAPVGAGADDQHALCRFPARRAYLTAALPELAAALPTRHCQAFARWRADHEVRAVSLVFAGYFPNNPASLFGHTFLRLHRRPMLPGEPEPPALLDFAVNYAANPTTGNPLAYSLLGLTGGFHGVLSLMPYYVKIQEYNNSESRDLWSMSWRSTPLTSSVSWTSCGTWGLSTSTITTSTRTARSSCCSSSTPFGRSSTSPRGVHLR